MLSKYFKLKVKTEKFINNTKRIIEEYKNKNVLICGDAAQFLELNKQYHFDTNFNIVAFVNFGKKKKLKFNIITPEQISAKNYDLILITDENSEKIYNKLYYDLNLEKANIEKLFFETIKDGKKNLDFLLNINFESRIKSLKRRFRNKKIVLYGAGALFELIYEYFDLSGLNIIGITDIRFKDTDNYKDFCGYPVCKPEEILKLGPDIVLITLKRFVPVWEDLYFGVCKHTNIGIKCIFKLTLFDLLCQIADT